MGEYSVFCNECHYTFVTDKTDGINYCPHCGHVNIGFSKKKNCTVDARQLMIINHCVNILAVEYLIKTNNDERYGELIDNLHALDDYNIDTLGLILELNRHIGNLGEAITQGDYDEQVEILLDVLERRTSHESYRDWK